jgi:UDPglucose--hexose-1-phosphate uridylyltransferase
MDMEGGIPVSLTPEFRWDPFYRRWVLISSKRGFRPRPQRREENTPPASKVDPECPFCPGNESQTPPPSYIDRGSDALQPWRVRVVENLFGAVERRGTPPASQSSPPPGFRQCPAWGIHEVIIESPIHDRGPAQYNDEEMHAVFLAYQNRLRVAWSEPGIEFALVFKNYGWDAGASLPHGHSQLMALPILPPLAVPASKDEPCLACAILESESGGPRSVANAKEWFAWSPYAAANPYECWLLPTRHESDFLALPEAELFSAAVGVRDLIRALFAITGDVAFNLVLHAAPRREGGVYRHWRIELLPRMTRFAGFEMGSGCYINPLPPEAAAEELGRQMVRMGYDR